MLAKLLVQLYFFVHGKLHLPGAGWLIRRLRPVVPGLQAFPLTLPEIGTITLDFLDESSFSLLNVCLGEYWGNWKLLRQMERFLGPDKVLWDVGANIGFMCIHFAASRHGLAAIHAFEPTPNPLKTLRSLFANHPRVHVHPIGLGDADEEKQILVSVRRSSLSSLVQPLDDGTPVRISIRRGDSYRKEKGLPLPDLIKIDVEGYEPKVLAGLRETIVEKRPVVLFEHGFLSEEVIRSLVPPEYTLYFIVDERTLSTDFKHRLGCNDAFLVPNEKRSLAESVTTS
jgi:FkbM family methyltransferase